MAKYQQGRDPRVTNESCWKGPMDNLLPNPPQDTKHEVDSVYAKVVAENKHNTEIIMAHEFREHPDGFKEIAQLVVDAYNEVNTLSVGGECPTSIATEEEE